MRLLLTLLPLVLAACSSAVKRDFAATWDAVMDPPAVPLGGPDLSIRVSEEALQRAINLALVKARIGADLDLGGTRFEPNIAASDLTLQPPGCTGCLSLDGGVTARIGWSVLGRAAGRIETTIGLGIDARPSLRPLGDSHGLFFDLAGVRRFSMSIQTKQPYIANLAQGPIRDWLTGALDTVLPAIRVARFGTGQLPVKQVQVMPSAEGLLLQLHSDSPTPAAIEDAPVQQEGWSARLSIASLLGIVRRETFEQGEMAFGTWADPRDLAIDGNRFAITLRVWRPKGGSGWWRDYLIEGDLSIRKGRLELEADEVAELDKSPNAALVDPLAALSKRRILQTLQGALQASLPASHAQDLGPIKSTWLIGSLTQEGDDLVVRGKVRFEARRR